MTKRISGRLAFLLAVLLVLVVVLAGWLALVSPERSKAATLDGQIGAANAKLVSTQAFLRGPASKQSVKDLALLRRAMPDDTRMSEIMRQLSWAAGRSGVHVDSITPSAPVATSGAQAVPVALSVTGHYFRLAKFMHLLRTRADVKNGKVHASGRLYAVDNIAFSTSAQGGLITATIALNAFTYGTAPVPAAPSTTTTTTGS